MTREELFSVFPRPWRISRDPLEAGTVFDANGEPVLQIDPMSRRGDIDCVALAELLVELGNGAEQ